MARIIKNNFKPNILKLEYDENWEFSSNCKDSIKELLTNNKDCIILLDASAYEVVKEKSRHAEEFLVDLAEEADNLAKANALSIHTAIAGKMRPYVTCTGRMTGKINFSGEHPGKAYAGRYYEQDKWDSVKSLMSMENQSKLYITADTKDGKNQQSSYDSASDSDVETDDEKQYVTKKKI